MVLICPPPFLLPFSAILSHLPLLLAGVARPLSPCFSRPFYRCSFISRDYFVSFWAIVRCSQLPDGWTVLYTSASHGLLPSLFALYLHHPLTPHIARMHARIYPSTIHLPLSIFHSSFIHYQYIPPYNHRFVVRRHTSCLY